MRRLARFIPIALLVTLAVTLTVVRLSRKPSPVATTPKATAAPSPSLLPSAQAIDLVDADVPLAAPRELHGSRRHTHRSAAKGPTTAKLAWTFDTGGPVEAQVITSPDEKTLYAASLSGKLYAIDREGKQRFTVDMGGRIYATPLCADDGTLYAGSDAKKLRAFAPDGTRKWELEVDDEIDTAITRTSKCIVAAAGRALYCVRTDGSVAWRFDAKGKIFSAPAIAENDLVVFGSQDRHLYAVRDGKVVYSVDLGADVDCSPAVDDDGTIHVGTDAGEVVTLNATGTILRRVNVGGFVRGSLAIARNGDVLAGVYGPTPKSLRIARDGSIRSALSIAGTGAAEFGVHGAPVEDSAGHLFFGAQDDLLYAASSSHEILFTFRTKGDVDAPVTILSDGALAFASDDGTVYYLAP